MATTAALALDTTMEAAEDAKPAADEFVFDAPAYYDLKNPALERRYVNNADGYFSSPTPSAATSRSSPPTADSFADKVPIEIEKAPLTDPDPVTRSLAGSYEAFKSGKEEAEAEAEARLAAPAYPQSSSTDNQQVEGKLSVSQLDNNAEDAEMTDGASVRGVPLDNQLHHEQDADEVMSDAGSEGTVAMDTTVVMTEAVEPAGPQQAMDVEAAATAILSHSQLTEDRPETFEEVFAQYASSSQSSATSYLMQELDVSKTSSHHYSPHSSFHSSQGSVSPHLRAGRRSPPPPLSDPVSMYSNNNGGYPPAPRSTGSSSGSYRHHRQVDDVSSKLMQPTQSYMRRLQAEQRVRDQNYMEDVPVEDKPHRATRPRSPRLRTTQKAQAHQKSPNDISRMSSTSRELLKIQEERLRLQMERLKIREFHEKTKVQRTPTNVFQRSTKQLTIPQSPNLQVDGRTRRVQYGNDTTANGEEAKPSIIEPETLMSRDYTIPTAKPHHSRTSGVPHPTVPHTPQLQTTARATRRGIVPDIHKQQEREQEHRAPSKTSGGITQPATPQLETKRRAQATASYRRPLEVVDKDEEELARKFHARPVNKKMLEPKLQQPSAAMGSGRAPLTKPVAPNLSTGSRPSARTGTTSAELERKRQEREQQRQMRGKPPQPTRQGPLPPRRPVVPETPPLKSIQLHRQYQEQFQRRVEAEARERAKQHNFKANPVRYTSNPQRFEGSTKPLTEFKPFEMPGEKYREQARERLESKRREEEEKLAAATAFHAMPMPEFTGDADGAGDRGFHVQPSTKPLTSFAAPKLASDRRAAERAAFDAAERERREQEEAYRKRVEEDARRLEEDEIKRLRKEKLVFHARPAPEAKPFLTKPSTKPLTEPMTPVTHFNPQRSQESAHE